jgi:hypothetical protein
MIGVFAYPPGAAEAGACASVAPTAAGAVAALVVFGSAPGADASGVTVAEGPASVGTVAVGAAAPGDTATGLEDAPAVPSAASSASISDADVPADTA